MSDPRFVDRSVPPSEPPVEPRVDDRRDEEESRFFTDRRLDALKFEIENRHLPVREHRAELVDAIVSAYQNGKPLLFQGETGSGKSVYSPGAVREALKKLGLKDRILMMQPRRDATTNVAMAVAAVEGETIGKGVGYSTSEAKELRMNTPIGVVTPGIFLRYAMNGQITKEQLGAIIIDELHETSIEYDLVMGMVKLMMEKGEAPLILLTSATIHKEQTQEYFGLSEEEYLRIEGRTYPVEQHYLSDKDLEQKRPDGRPFTYIDQCVEATKIICDRPDTGDVLVFMPGAKEIDATIQTIGTMPGVEVLRLHGNLHPQERQYALSGKRPGGIKRRVIVCTNIAETSLTVPGVKFVVDSCRKKCVRYNEDTGIEETEVELISQVEADQRKGRAGREQEGIAIRALTEEQFQRSPQYPEPEITRKNSELLVLRLKRIGVDEESFPFPNPPNSNKLAAAKEHLVELEALDADESLTDVGLEMLNYPFEPNISKMIIEAKKMECVEAALLMAAFTREKNILPGPTRDDIAKASGMTEESRKVAARMRAQEAQKEFTDPHSDWVTLMNVFVKSMEHGVFEMSHLHRKSKAERTPDEVYIVEHYQDWCRTHYVNPVALTHIAYKLREYAQVVGVRFDQSTFAEKVANVPKESVSSVLLHAFSHQLHRKTMSRGLPTYQRIGGFQEMVISPGSVVFSTAPALCVTNEVREGGGKQRDMKVKRNYGQLIHEVTQEDIRRTFPERMKVVTGDATFDSMTGGVVQSKTTYFNNQGRQEVLFAEQYKPAEPGEETARLLASAICRGRLDTPFHRSNMEILAEVGEDCLAPDTGAKITLEDWYAARLLGAVNAHDVLNLSDQLSLSHAKIVSPERAAKMEQKFPSAFTFKGVSYPIEYSSSEVFTGGRYVKQRKAKIRLPLEIAMQVTSLDIPVVGDELNPVRMSFESGGVGAPTLDSLQKGLDDELIRNAFRFWEDKPRQQRVRIDGTRPLPPIATLGFQPIQFATNRHRDAVMAYPAYRYAFGVREPKDVDVVYVQTSYEAERSSQYAEEQRKEMFEEKKRNQKSVTEPVEGPMQRALREARERKEGKKEAEPVVAVTRKIEVDQPKEDVMTPEIRRDFEERLEMVEVLFEQAATYGVKTAKEVSKKETAKEKAKVAVYDRVKELRREFKEVSEAIAVDGALPSRIDGKVAALRQATEVMFKKNVSQIVPNYADRWVDVFELAWKSVPEVVDANEEVGEYIKEGMIDRAEFIGRIQKKLKEKMEQLQKGEVEEGMVENLVEQTFGEY